MNPAFEKHVKNPHNLGILSSPDGYANPVGECGESIELFLYIDEDKIKHACFLPHGCGFTIACGSVLTEMVEGSSLDDAFDLTPEQIEQALGGLPEDHKHCAALAARTIKDAITFFYRGERENWKILYQS